jgi:hypothetical protein
MASVACDTDRVVAATGSSELDEVTAEVNDSVDPGVKPVSESYGTGNVLSRGARARARRAGVASPRRAAATSQVALGALAGLDLAIADPGPAQGEGMVIRGLARLPMPHARG